MGWLSRATGCVLLVTLSTQAHAGMRIAYPSSSQMYALLASDVQVTFGTELPKAPIVEAAAPAPDAADHMPVLLPARRSFPAIEISPLAETRPFAEIRFMPSVRDYAIAAPGVTPPPGLDPRTNSFWEVRQDVFPEEQRIRMRSPIDAMLTFSIGGSSAPGGSLSIDGGVAGALWTMHLRQYAQ